MGTLTPHEQRCLEMLAREGKTPNEIAAAVNISRRSVTSLFQRIRFKLRADTTAQMVYIAIKKGLIE